MPNVEVSLRDMSRLVGKKLSLAEFGEAVLYVKGEIDAVENDRVTIDVKETNRPDLWSAEGIARELKARLGKEKGVPKYGVKKGKISCTIEKSVEKARPFIACAVVKNVKVTGEFLKQMIQLQEKVGTSFGRKRKEAGIGLYDFKKMKAPVFYRGYKDNEIEFTPLEFGAKMRPSEIISEHPKGVEFGHLLEGSDRYPIVIDSENTVASMPPIINSETTGKITEKTMEIFVESTGFNWETVNTALNVIVMALADRGGKIESVKINFPKTATYPKKPIYTPAFGTKKIIVKLDDIRKMTGLDLGNREIIGLLERARYNAKIIGRHVAVEYPGYRQDIIHPVDVIEDILISHGYNEIEPEAIELATIGTDRIETRQIDLARDVSIGLGLQEVLTFTMTSRQKQTGMIGVGEEEKFVEIANPVNENYTIFRKQLFPELLDFLSKNRHVEYPQKIFEVGKTIELNPKAETGVSEKNTLCILLCDKRANFTLAKSVLDAVCNNLGLKHEIAAIKHPSLEEGKSALVNLNGKKGLVGEISKKVLANFGLDTPTVIVEIGI